MASSHPKHKIDQKPLHVCASCITDQDMEPTMECRTFSEKQQNIQIEDELEVFKDGLC